MHWARFETLLGIRLRTVQGLGADAFRGQVPGPLLEAQNLPTARSYEVTGTLSRNAGQAREA